MKGEKASRVFWDKKVLVKLTTATAKPYPTKWSRLKGNFYRTTIRTSMLYRTESWAVKCNTGVNLV